MFYTNDIMGNESNVAQRVQEEMLLNGFYVSIQVILGEMNQM